MQNMETLRSWATRVVAGPTVRQAEPAQHWDDRKSQSRCVMRRICPRRSGPTWRERLWNLFNWEEQMMSDAHRSVRPGVVAQWSTTQNGHILLSPSGPDSQRGDRKTPCLFPGCGSSPPGGAFVRLEPCEGKLSRTVLRGARGRNRSRLPDSTCPRKKANSYH